MPNDRRIALDALFDTHWSKTEIDLHARIQELNWPEDTLQRMEEKGWIFQMGGNLAQVHWQVK